MQHSTQNRACSLILQANLEYVHCQTFLANLFWEWHLLQMPYSERQDLTLMGAVQVSDPSTVHCQYIDKQMRLDSSNNIHNCILISDVLGHLLSADEHKASYTSFNAGKCSNVCSTFLLQQMWQILEYISREASCLWSKDFQEKTAR